MILPASLKKQEQEDQVLRSVSLCMKEVPESFHNGNHGHSIHLYASSSQFSGLGGPIPAIGKSFDVSPTMARNQRCKVVLPHSKKSRGSVGGSQESQMRVGTTCVPPMTYIYNLHEDPKHKSIIDANLDDGVVPECKPPIHSIVSKGQKKGLLDVRITRSGNRVSKEVFQGGLLSSDKLCNNDIRITGNPQACDDFLAPRSVPPRSLLTKRPSLAVNEDSVPSKQIVKFLPESKKGGSEIDIYELPSDPGEVPIATLSSRGRKRPTAPSIASGARRKQTPKYRKKQMQKNTGGCPLNKNASHIRNAEFHFSKAYYNRTQKNIFNHCQPEIPGAPHNTPDEEIYKQGERVEAPQAQSNLALTRHVKPPEESKTLGVESPNSVSVKKFQVGVQSPVQHLEMHCTSRDSSVKFRARTSPVDGVLGGENSAWEDDGKIISMFHRPMVNQKKIILTMPQDRLAQSVCNNPLNSKQAKRHLGNNLGNKPGRECRRNMEEASKSSPLTKAATKFTRVQPEPEVNRGTNIYQEKTFDVTPKVETQVPKLCVKANTTGPLAHNTPPGYLLQQCLVQVSNARGPGDCIGIATRSTDVITPVIPFAECQITAPCIAIGQTGALRSELRVRSPGFTLENDSQPQTDLIFPATRSVNNIVPLVVPHIYHPPQPSNMPISDLQIMTEENVVPSPKPGPAFQSVSIGMITDIMQVPELRDLLHRSQQAPERPKIAKCVHDPFTRESQLISRNKHGPLNQDCLAQVPRMFTPYIHPSRTASPELWPTYDSHSRVKTRKEISITVKPGLQSIATIIDRDDAEELSEQKRGLLQTDSNTKVYNLSSF